MAEYWRTFAEGKSGATWERMQLRFEDEEHRYFCTDPTTKKEMGLPSVSQVIGAWKDKPAWFSNELAKAGTRRHLVCEILDRGGITFSVDKEGPFAIPAIEAKEGDKISLSDEVNCEFEEHELNANEAAALRSWCRFKRDYGAGEMHAIEQPMMSAELGVAGTVDRVMQIHAGTEHQQNVIVDIKGPSKLPTYPLQVAAYAAMWSDGIRKARRKAVRENLSVQGAMLVHLKRNGDYEVVSVSREQIAMALDCFTALVSALAYAPVYGLGKKNSESKAPELALEYHEARGTLGKMFSEFQRGAQWIPK